MDTLTTPTTSNNTRQNQIISTTTPRKRDYTLFVVVSDGNGAEVPLPKVPLGSLDDLSRVLVFFLNRAVDTHSLEYYDSTARGFFPLTCFDRLPPSTTLRVKTTSKERYGPVLVRPKLSNDPTAPSLVFAAPPKTGDDALRATMMDTASGAAQLCAEIAHSAVSETSRGPSVDWQWEANVDVLVSVLHKFASSVSTVAVALLGLWNVTSYTAAQRYAARVGAVNAVCSVLVRHFHHGGVASASMGVLRNLSLYGPNSEVMLSWGAVHLMVAALRHYASPNTLHRGVVLRSLAALAPAMGSRPQCRLVAMQSSLPEVLANVFERFPGIDCVVYRWTRLLTALFECPTCDSKAVRPPTPPGATSSRHSCETCMGLSRTLAAQFVQYDGILHVLEAVRKFKTYSGIVLHATIALLPMCTMSVDGPAAPSHVVPFEVLPLLDLHSDNGPVVCRVLRLMARVAQHSTPARVRLLAPSLKCVERCLISMSKSQHDESVQTQGVYLLEIFIFHDDEGFALRLLRAGAPFILTTMLRTFTTNEKLCVGGVRCIHYLAVRLKGHEYRSLIQQCGAAQCIADVELRLPRKSEGSRLCREVLKLLCG
eukprot:PhM_4_TR10522/c0_g1_i1/m.77913